MNNLDKIKREILWSDDQLEIINTQDMNLLVSASSGSGKTTVMIERIFRLLLSGASLENILVTTFTNAAARDMREKLQKKLIDEAAAQESERQRRHIAAQLELLESANISTLHSFCANLIRAYYYMVGVDQGFSIIDETESRLKKAKCIKDIINSYGEKGDSDFMLLLDIFSRHRKPAPLIRMIDKIYEYSCIMPDRESWLRKPYEPECADKYIDQYLNIAKHYFLTKAGELKEKSELIGFAKGIETAQLIIDSVKGNYYDQNFVRLVLTKEQNEDVLFLDAKTQAKELKEEYKKFFSEFYKLIEPESDEQLELIGKLRKKLAELVTEYGKQYALLKLNDFELDYSDLEYYAYLILSEPEIQGEVRSKYLYVFVDEYQDINPMQEAIIKAIANKDNLFMVGDVKQSIYRFRLCDPQIFIDKRERFMLKKEPFSKTINLNDNFRSAHSILEFNNELFSRIMTTTVGAVNYKRDAMLQRGNPDIKSDYPVVKISLVREQKEKAAEPDRIYSVKNDISSGLKPNAEAELILREINAVIEKGLINDNGVVRRPTYKDIVILFRAIHGKQKAEMIKQIAAAVPVVSSLDIEIMQSTEILRLLDFVRILSNPYQDYALSSVLKWFAGFSEDELIEIRASRKSAEFFHQAVYSYAQFSRTQTASKLKKFLQEADALRSYALCHSVSELIRKIIKDYDYENLLLSEDDGETKCRNVEMFLNSLEAARYNSYLEEFLRYIDSTEAEPSMKAPVPAEENAIRIMTIHQSKGLEFPVVIVGDLGRKFNEKREEFLLDKDLGIAIKNYNPINKTIDNSHLYQSVLFNYKHRDKEEEMRIMYVAFTRAKNHLILTGSIDEDYILSGYLPYEVINAKSPLDWVLSVFGKDPRYCTLWDCASPEIIKPCFAMEVTDASELTGEITAYINDNSVPHLNKKEDALVKAIAENVNFVYKGSNLEAKYTVTELNEGGYILKSEKFVAQEDVDYGDFTAADIGNAYHYIMKEIDINAVSIDQVKAEIERIKRLYNNDEIFDKVDAQKIVCVQNCSLFEDVRKKGYKYWREKEFLVFINGDKIIEGDSESALLQGVIDIMIKTDEGFIICDYKTTRGNEQYLVERYKTQLNLYAHAASSILGKQVIKKYIYSFLLDKLIDVA